MSKQEELFGYDKKMILQCVIIYACMWCGLLVSKNIFLGVAAYTILTAFCGKTETLYYQLFFTLPFGIIYKLSPESTSLFTYVMIVSGAIITMRKCRIQGVVLGLFFVLGTYMIVGMGDSYTIVLKMMAGLFLLYIFVISVSPSDYKNQIMSYSLGMLGASIIGSFKTTWPYLMSFFRDTYYYVGSEQIVRFSGLENDPNYYAIAVIFAVFLCLRMLFSGEGKRKLLMIVIGVMVIFGFVSYSKMYLFTFIILAVLFWFHHMKSREQILITIILTPIIIAILLNWAIRSGYWVIIRERLFGGEISTGRFEIWKKYAEYLSYSNMTFFWGDGLGSGYYRFSATHNSYIELVYHLGIIGGGLFVFTISYIIGCVKHVKRREVFDYSLLVLFLFMIMALHVVTINNLMFYFMLIWISMNMRKEEKLE